MKIFKLIASFFIIGTFLLLPSFQAFAQTRSSVKSVAEVNVSGAKIEDQVKNVFSISFYLTNGKGLQNDVSYSVRLSPKGKVGTILDEKVYEESLTLRENSSLQKSIAYEAPTNLTGSYTLSLFVGNKTGLPLGFANLGEATLSGTEKGVLISPESCSLLVSGKGENKKFSVVSIPAVALGQTLKLSCSVSNSLTSAVALSTNLETFDRNLFGAKQDLQNSFAPIELGADEKKTIEFLIPLVQNPGSYKASLLLQNEKISSNKVVFGYSVPGFSANIFNISTDKDVYKKGEVASVDTLWSVSGRSVASLGVKIKSGRGAICGEASVNNPTSNQNTLVSIKKNCFNPQVISSLKDKEGNTLVERYTSIETTSEKDTSLFSGKKGPIVIIIILILIALLGVWMKRKNVNKTAIGGMAVFVILSVLPFAKADASYIIPTSSGDIFVTVSVTNVSNPGSTTYNQGDLIKVDGYMQSFSSLDTDVSLSAVTVGNTSVELFYPSTQTIGPSNPTIFGNTQYFTVNVPTTPPLPQTFTVDFSAGVDEPDTIYVAIETSDSGPNQAYCENLGVPSTVPDGGVNTTYTAKFYASVADYENNILLNVAGRNLKLKYNYFQTQSPVIPSTTTYTPVLSGSSATINTVVTSYYQPGQYVPEDCEYSASYNTGELTVLDGSAEAVPYQIIPMPPVIHSFIGPSSAYRTVPFDLSWFSSNATSCSGTNFTASATGGTASVSQSATTTYTLTCSNILGSDTKNVTVTDLGVAPTPTYCYAYPGNSVSCNDPGICVGDPSHPGYEICQL